MVSPAFILLVIVRDTWGHARGNLTPARVCLFVFARCCGRKYLSRAGKSCDSVVGGSGVMRLEIDNICVSLTRFKCRVSSNYVFVKAIYSYKFLRFKLTFYRL